MQSKINPTEVMQKLTKKGPFTVIEYTRDPSVNPYTAETEYFNSLMNVRRRQVMCSLKQGNKIVTQRGAMQWTIGTVESTTGIKGVGDMAKKMFTGKVTGESAVKPEYVGEGKLMLEPTYKHIILEDLADWSTGLVVEDGMFLACEGTVQHHTIMRNTVSSAALGNEGLFNLAFDGSGVVALESMLPRNELMLVEIAQGENIKIDGSYAVCWSGNLDFTVERSSKTLIGSTMNGEGFVNVYRANRGPGKLLLCPTAPYRHSHITSSDY